MWKIAVGFVIFAALAMYVLINSGADVDMGGEKHGTETHEPAASAPAAASDAAAPASAASAASGS